MELPDYKSNSNASKESAKKTDKNVQKAIAGTARQRKKSEIRKFTDIFISEDVDNVKSYILLDVIVPSVKRAVSDVIKNGIDMLLYGETDHRSSSSTASKVSYRSYYDKNKNSEPRQVRSHTGYGYDDIVLDSRGEAQEVLDRMDELVATYGTVSVADMYDLVGISGSYTDNKYGWTDIRSARIVRIRDGFVIKMPRALPLD